MLPHAPFGRWPRWRLLLIAVSALCAGCIADNGSTLVVVPELVVAPQNPTFQAINYSTGTNPPEGQMLVHWNRSVADTQLNFKGYLVELWKSDTADYSIYQSENLRILLDTAVILHAPGKRTDTFCTFANIPSSKAGIPLGRYTVVVWSLKTSDTTHPSTDSSFYSALFDPLPMQNPTNLRATSTGPQSVLLEWTDPPTDKDTGFFQYIVYYRDPTRDPFDTGHVGITVPKHGVLNDGNDSMAAVSVPAASGTNSLAPEYPYQFWVKSERIDSTIFYGGDTNSVIWAGAEEIPKTGGDTAVADTADAGFLLVPNNDTIYIGPYGSQYDMLLDTFPIDVANIGQIIVNISGQTVTLTTNKSSGASFLPGREDPASGIDSIFYSTPVATASQFTAQSITLVPTNTTGVVVYVMMNDNVNPNLGNEWARLFIRMQSIGTFVNPNILGGGIDMKGSFQPGLTKDGSSHLPYY